MNQQKSLIRNTLNSAVSSFSTVFLFFLLILSGRYLGADDFGRFSFAMAFVFLFDPILDPGLYHLLIREIARKKEDAKAYLSHALTWKLLLSPLVFLTISIIVNIIHDDKRTVQAVYLMAVASFLKSFKDVLRTSLMANEFFGWNASTIVIDRILLLSFGAFVLLNGMGLLWLCWVFVLSRAVDLIITLVIVFHKVCKVTIGKDIRFVKNIVISAVPIGAFYITINIYNYVDTVMLSVLRTNAEVGWYNASYKIYEGLFIFPGILCTVFMPRLSLLYKESKELFEKLLIRGMKYVFFLALMVSVNGVLLSNKIIITFFGDSYMNSIASMDILLVGALFVFSLNFLHMVMIAMYKQRVILVLAIFGLVLNVALNLLLIPRHGYLGAAFATVAVESLLFITLNLYLYKLIHRVEVFNVFGKCILSSILPVMIFVWVIPVTLIYLKLFLINISTIILLLILGYLDEEELKYLSNLIYLRKKVVTS